MATKTAAPTTAHRDPMARLVFPALALGILSCAVYACILMFVPTTNGQTFTTAGDYWLTAVGIPMVAALLAATAGIHRLQGGRDGRFGLTGLIITTVAVTAFATIFILGLITGTDHAPGPMYPLAVITSLAGLVIFTIGMIRARLLPPWAGPALATGWLAGGPIPFFAAAPLLLAAVYATLAILLRRATGGPPANMGLSRFTKAAPAAKADPGPEMRQAPVRKALAAVIGAVLVTTALGGASLAAASTRTVVSGTEHFQLMNNSATSKTSSIIAAGTFTAGGTSTATSRTTTTVTFPDGTFVITHSKGTGTHSFNPRTCLFKGNLKGTYTLGSGTGAYANLSGSGTYQVSLLGVAAKSGGRCSTKLPPAASQQFIRASGPVSLH
jgi:hypothetical protein